METARTMDSAAALAEQAAEMDEIAAGTVVGEYVVEAKVGEGGMGQVYAARHPLIGKKAAIKVISRSLSSDRSSVERFVQEARAVNQIGHPNIVDIFSFGTLPDGRSYFVMEYLQGETLSERMRRGGMSLGEAAGILDQIADALEAAHEKGIVHRDLKPDNAFLVTVRGGRQIVKLLDFGIAKLAGTSDQRMERTRTGTMMGTPAYISPEQARGKNVDFRTDVYSLGCMAFEMFLGRLPFDADNPMDMIASHLSAPPPRALQLWPECPESLDALLVSMMDKDPARRPSLAIVRAHLKDYGGTVAGLGTQALGRQAGYVTPVPGSMVRSTPTPQPSAAMAASPAPVAATNLATIASEPRPNRGKIYAVGAIVAVVGVGVAAIAMIVSANKARDAPLQGAAVIDSSTAPQPQPAAPPAPRPAETPTITPDPPAPAPRAGGTLMITVDADDARIEVDGVVATRKGDRAELTFDADGAHVVSVTAPGHRPAKKNVDVAGGATVPLAFDLERLRSAPTATKPDRPPAGTTKKPDLKKGPGKDTDYTLDPFKKKPR